MLKCLKKLWKRLNQEEALLDLHSVMRGKKTLILKDQSFNYEFVEANSEEIYGRISSKNNTFAITHNFKGKVLKLCDSVGFLEVSTDNFNLLEVYPIKERI